MSPTQDFQIHFVLVQLHALVHVTHFDVRKRHLFFVYVFKCFALAANSFNSEQVTFTNHVAHNTRCSKLCFNFQEVQLDPVERRRDVKNILTITQHAGWRPDSTIFDWGGWFPFLAQCIRLKKSPYPQVSGTVLGSERLRNAIEQAAQEAVTEKRQLLQKDDDDHVTFDENSYYVEMLRKHEKRAKRLIWDMRSKLSDVMLRITSWVLYKLLPCFLSGVVAHPAQVEMLKAAAAKSPKAPLIFLPLHRSHLDYILVSFILLNNDIRSPIVAAGENLRIPFFGSLLRGLGAFFIKRKIDPVVGKKDVVYRAVLHTYMQEALKVGHNVEFFIEGGRTRTGKPCMPKVSSSISISFSVSLNFRSLLEWCSFRHCRRFHG